jgi:pimeloyl-ACP methyl ester carboxylesterase
MPSVQKTAWIILFQGQADKLFQTATNKGEGNNSMLTEKINQTKTLSDGRALGFAEYGDFTGSKTIFYFHGSGGSRLDHPPDESILVELGLRFVAIDRPGHGLSSPQPDRKLLDWPTDISQLANHLDVERFYVMGWSAGGPHALACAYKLPKHVIAGAIVSGLAPTDRPNPYAGMPLPLKMLNFLGRKTPGLVYLFRRLMYPMVMGEPEKAGKKLASSFPTVDRQLAEKPENQKMLVASIQEGYKQGWQGPSQDDIVINSPWGFRLEDIGVRIDIWQGEVDKNVPLNQGKYQHAKIPNSTLTVLPGQAHLYILANWRKVFEKLVAE